MKISGLKTTDVQPTLFDLPPMPIRGHGHVRTLLGEWGELLTLMMTGGRKHRTDSRCDYCPDISVGDHYLETKTAGNTNQTFIYTGRLDKDWEFASTRSLWYVIWHHAAETKRHEFVVDLLRDFTETLKAVYVVPFWFMYSTARRRPCEKLNSNYGASRTQPRTYGSGYRVPLSHLQEFRIG